MYIKPYKTNIISLARFNTTGAINSPNVQYSVIAGKRFNTTSAILIIQKRIWAQNSESNIAYKSIFFYQQLYYGGVKNISG